MYLKKAKGIILFQILFLFIIFSNNIYAENIDKEKFIINGEFRPRTELRNGYRNPFNSKDPSAFFTTQRSRLNLLYSKENYTAYLSVQDIRVWGEDNLKDYSGMLSTFQAWFEIPIIDNLFLKIGRQAIAYDNNRLFSENNWRQNSGSHDGISFKFNNKTIESDLVFAFNQNKENISGTNYSTDDIKDQYKLLIISLFKYNINDFWKISLINTSDAFQEKEKSEIMKFRFTNGGRVELNYNKFYSTISSYYQHGKTRDNKNISSFFIEPEIKYSVSDNFTIRLGSEIFSGQDPNDKNNFTSFIPLYGVAHKFNGTMDYFTKFPDDTKAGGLINPYLFFIYDLNKDIKIRSDFHIFYSLNNLFNKDNKIIDKYLGFETDLLLNYQINKELGLELGYSFLIPSKSMETIKSIENINPFQQWTYLQLTYKPEFFKFIK